MNLTAQEREVAAAWWDDLGKKNAEGALRAGKRGEVNFQARLSSDAGRCFDIAHSIRIGKPVVCDTCGGSIGEVEHECPVKKVNAFNTL